MDFKIKKGYDLRLDGHPTDTLVDLPPSRTVAVYPLECDGIRQRLLVEEGDRVNHGAALIQDKKRPDFTLRAPAGGRVRSITRGARRFVEQILIEVDEEADVERFNAYTPETIATLDRQTILNQLVNTGYLALIRQRPFSRMASPDLSPKSIFVNGMNTAPFTPSSEVSAASDPEAFQAGLDIMTRLTDGTVHLCVGNHAGPTLQNAERVHRHRFTGPHPAGNTSVHISRIDPMNPTDVVWTIKAVDLLLIGRLFLDGQLPATQIVSLGGSRVKPEARTHYRMRMGGDLTPLFETALEAGDLRVINGDLLTGSEIATDSHLRLRQSAITVIPQDRERLFMGWTMPGLNQMSFSRLFASSWLRKQKRWEIGTNLHGEQRAMVLTGYYDRVVPLNIMVDFLVRAVLAGDTDEAIALGILETDPEDFALCDVICPSKIEVQEIIREGLKQIEEEGI